MESKRYIIVILVIAALLRVIFISSGDTVTDEVLYGFRAIGPMDFDEAEEQTTPLEWLDLRTAGGYGDIPFWTKLSFHDHPPLVFWVQHISIRVFGENNFGLRFPSAVFGIASVYLIYALGKILYTEKVGIIASAIISVTTNHVYISRIGLQESYVIFFILLTSYLFIKSFKNDKYFIYAGISLGFAFLAKYTTFILIPIYAIYVILKNNKLFLNKRLIAGLLISALIFSPVIIYNIMLYKNFGHFDFQFSHLFSQNPDVWQSSPGKEIGSIGERIYNVIPRLISSHSVYFLLLFSLALISFIKRGIKYSFNLKRHTFLFISFILFLFFITFIIGPSFRFLSMLTVFPALFTAYVVSENISVSSKKAYIYGFLAIFFITEIIYSLNTLVITYPLGPEKYTYARGISMETYNYGYNSLGEYLEQELDGKRPLEVFNMKYKFLENLHEETIKGQLENKLEPLSAVIVYDDNIDHLAQLWVLDRLNIYHAWPVLSMRQYAVYMKENNFSDPTSTGFKNYYFISMHEIKDFLSIYKNIPIIDIIKNKRGDNVFWVYKFQL